MSLLLVKVSLNYLKTCLPTLIVSLILVAFPKSFCQELNSNSSNMLYIDTIVNVDDINFKEGKLTQGFFRLRLEANKSFGVFIFSPSIHYNNLWDDRTSYLDGWYHLLQQYFPRGLEARFNLNELIFYNEVLEYGYYLVLTLLLIRMHELSTQILIHPYRTIGRLMELLKKFLKRKVLDMQCMEWNQ